MENGQNVAENILFNISEFFKIMEGNLNENPGYAEVNRRSDDKNHRTKLYFSEVQRIQMAILCMPRICDRNKEESQVSINAPNFKRQ